MKHKGGKPIMPEKKLDLSIVIAAYNEESIIKENLERVRKELVPSDLTWEIICVNDGSSDATGKLMKEFSEGSPQIFTFHHRRNFGQGRAIRTAFDFCRGQIIVTLDADLSYHPKYIFLLRNALIESQAEIAIASPYAPGGEVKNVPFFRYFLSRFGNIYLAGMSKYPISTLTCVVRAYRREVIDSLFFSSDGMELQLEILMKASTCGFQVTEIPAQLEWSNEKSSEFKNKRQSKMRILTSIQLYLLLGWLSRPALLFILLSSLLLGMGGYLGWNTAIVFLRSFSMNYPTGTVQAISLGLRETVSSYFYGMTFGIFFFMSGFLLLTFSLLFLQSKFYFEELFKMFMNVNRRVGRILEKETEKS